MPKKKNAVSTNKFSSFVKSGKKTFLKHRILGIFLIVVGVWALLWIGQAGVERYRFYEAEKKIDKLAYKLQREVGNDKEFVKRKYCAYSSVPYGKGRLRCSIYVTQDIKEKNIENINSRTKNFLNKFKSNQLINPDSFSSNNKSLFSNEDFLFENTFNEINYNFKFNESNLYCSYILRPVANSTYSLNILIGCTEKTKFPYFPVQK